jgi:mannose-6-phosphate isomerase-like protein (cupin superfamily)
MIHAGFVIENPTTGSRTTVVESDAETHGRGWLLEVTCLPNARPDVPAHTHLAWTETFEVLQGTAFYKINGVKHTARAGDAFTVLPQQSHVHPWNAGDGKLVFRQRNEFEQSSPEAVQDVLGVFATIAGLAREGKVDQSGVPRNPLQFFASLRTLAKHGGYDARLPIPLQKFLVATLGRLAELLGYRGVYPRYVDT